MTEKQKLVEYCVKQCKQKWSENNLQTDVVDENGCATRSLNKNQKEMRRFISKTKRIHLKDEVRKDVFDDDLQMRSAECRYSIVTKFTMP